MLNVKHTLIGCYLGYVAQAVVNCMMPLFYAIFNKELNISIDKIGLIATINFCIQIGVDFGSTLFVEKVGYRKSIIISHALSVFGLILLGILPNILKNKFLAIIIATIVMAIGGGLIEVLINPLVQAIPLDNKEKRMSFMHSFYCWGHCLVVLGTTLFFSLFGENNWWMLPLIWTVVPLFNCVLFIKAPIYILPVKEDGKAQSLYNNPVFYIIVVMMVCAGVSEVAMSNWASIFVELGLNVDKTVGDLLGVCSFAFFMGLGRIFSGILTKKFRIESCLIACAIGCFLCYMGTIFFVNRFISILGCAFSGFFVSLFWPGTYSIGAERIERGGTRMFAFFALAGDIGCSVGSYLVGFIADKVEEGSLILPIISDSGRQIKTGLLFASIFPLLMIICGFIIKNKSRDKKSDKK